MLEAAISVN